MTSLSAHSEIHQLTERMVDAFVKRDLSSFAALFADDIVVMPPGNAPVVGNSAFHSLIESMFSGWSIAEMMIETKDISVNGDVATVWGLEATMSTNNDTGETSRNHYNIFWALRRCEDGQWQINRILWNANPQQEPDERNRILRRKMP
jgi:uncharacterized protein (TIGR02246 family)